MLRVFRQLDAIFQRFSTRALQFQVIGNGINLSGGLVRQFTQGWPQGWLGWAFWLIPMLAILLLGSLVQAQARVYFRRADRPRYIWHLDLNLESDKASKHP
jgi:hypothetical protein